VPPGPKPEVLLVRADITYLRQDFSALLFGGDRFDFLVRERPVTRGELLDWFKQRNAGPTRRELALLFVLRELTGRDPGPTIADWKRLAASAGVN
jgi:hypothetical protein